MRTLTFTLDVQTGDDAMAPATVTIMELADGSLSFELSNEMDSDNLIGDLRALFFDVSDDALLGTLSVDGADVTEFNQTGSVSNLGGGATSNGVPDSPYEVGVEIGTSGAADNDIQTTTFVLSSSLRSLTLDDIALESFTVRQTSVGEIDGDRSASDKLWGDAPYPVNAIDDELAVSEDQIVWANLLANDIDLDGSAVIVTSVDGQTDNVGQTLILADGVSLYVAENGEYSLDATDADYLSAGEILEFQIQYGADDQNGGTDEAILSLTLSGTNDGPVALDDIAQTLENVTISSNVLTNDSDIDRLDTISVTGVNGDTAAVGSEITLASGALLTLNSDGSFDFNPNGAYDHLNEGETATESFTYEISDNHGATDTATVDITIEGIGSTVVEPQGDHFATFANKKGTADHEISNVVLYMENEDGILKVKIDSWDSGETDLDNVNLDGFMESFYADYELLGASVKAGNNQNKDLGPGEGQFFLMDGDEDIDYIQGGEAPEGISYQTLEAKADVTISYDDSLFV